MWDWDKDITLHKEQNTTVESLTDYGYSGMNKGTKIRHFLQGIKSTELDAASILFGSNQKCMNRF